jgi:carbon storage regulator CsrA
MEYRPTMLFGTRRIGETPGIGDDIQVTVLDIKDNQVRLKYKVPWERACAPRGGL